MLVCTGRGDAYDLLTHAVRAAWGLSPLPELARTPAGKPFFPAHPQLHFNLSHSPPYTLCALSRAPVGVDIQTVKPTWRAGLPRRVCSPQQLDWLARQPDYWSSFALLWAMKEAYVKYTGTGLTGDIRSIPTPLPVPGQTLYRLGSLYVRIYPGRDVQAAVCGEEIPPPVPVENS